MKHLFNISNLTINVNISKGDNFNAYYIFKYYFQLTIFSTGLIGNLASLLIFIRPNLNKKTNTGILYITICTINLVYFINNFIDNCRSLFDCNIQLPNETFTFIQNSLPDLLTWMQVLISFDRFIMVVFPIKNILTKKVFLIIRYYFLSVIN